MAYMKNPRRVFEEYMEGRVSFDRYGYRLGLRAMGLEIAGLIKTLEALPVEDEHTPVVISVLHTLLQDNEMDVEAYRDYEQLSEWRKPRFTSDEPYASQPRNEPSALRRVTHPVSALSYPEESTARKRTSRALPPEHRAHLPSDETAELDPDDGGERATPSE